MSVLGLSFQIVSVLASSGSAMAHRVKFVATVNAVPFAGQSDIKKLRRENYQLRKEIWTLRDEHDRIGKLLRSRNCDGGGSSSYVGAGDSDADEKIAIDDYVDDYDCEYDDDYRCCSCHSNEVLLSVSIKSKSIGKKFHFINFI